jgi:hypothetical protein
MPNATKPVRTPGSVAVAIVVGLMFVTPVLAATTLRPLTISWSALVDFVSVHQFELMLGFGLMIAIALLLKAVAFGPSQPAHPLQIMPDGAPRGVDGLA